MSRLVVMSADPMTTIQDGGRWGGQRFGLPPSGAMDQTSLAIANALVGNPIFGAAIEVGPFGATFSARGGAIRLALSGAQRSATIAGVSIEFNRTLVIEENKSLCLGAARDGVFSYLAIEGGLPGKPIFGSLAVNIRAGIGSPFSRALQARDELTVNEAQESAAERKIELPATTETPIRVVLGPQDDEFSGDAIDKLLSSEWTISPASDRMGYRIEGPALTHNYGHNIVSDGTVTGSIQVPGNGQPIVLMPDHGTTGGYPKIATVVSVDLGRFAQTRAGDRVRFRAISIEDAQAEAKRLDTFLKSLPARIVSINTIALNMSALQNANLAGAAVNAIDITTW